MSAREEYRPAEGEGVHAFKEGFHGRVEEYVGTYGKGIKAVGKVYVARQGYREFGEVT